MPNRRHPDALAAEGKNVQPRQKRSKGRDLQQGKGAKDAGDKPGRMNIAEVLQLDRTETREGEWNGQQFSVSFYPARLSSPLVMQGIEEGINGRPLRLADALAGLLADWSIDWNGSPFPPDKHNLAICPFEFVVYVAGLVTPETKAGESHG